MALIVALKACCSSKPNGPNVKAHTRRSQARVGLRSGQIHCGLNVVVGMDNAIITIWVSRLPVRLASDKTMVPL